MKTYGQGNRRITDSEPQGWTLEKSLRWITSAVYLTVIVVGACLWAIAAGGA